MLDGEAAVLLRAAPCINSSALQTLLPCDDRLWTAPTAEAWLQLKETVRDPVPISVVLKHLSSDSATPLPAVISLGPLAAQCVLSLSSFLDPVGGIFVVVLVPGPGPRH